MLLYHYTSIENLLKICNVIDDKICVHATNAKYLNDPTEHSIPLELVEKAISELNKDGKDLKDVKSIEHRFNELCESLLGFPFIFPMSRHRDDIMMWRAYGDNGKGAAIGFKKDILHEYGKNENITLTSLFDCCYDTKKIYDELVKEMKSCLDKSGIFIMPFNKEDFSIDLNIFNFLYKLSFLSFRAKNPSYTAEKEWRLCMFESDDNKIKFKVRNGFVVPYIEHFLPKNVIKEIVIGPCANFELIKGALVIFFGSKKYTSPYGLIKPSKVQYRI